MGTRIISAEFGKGSKVGAHPLCKTPGRVAQKSDRLAAESRKWRKRHGS